MRCTDFSNQRAPRLSSAISRLNILFFQAFPPGCSFLEDTKLVWLSLPWLLSPPRTLISAAYFLSSFKGQLLNHFLCLFFSTSLSLSYSFSDFPLGSEQSCWGRMSRVPFPQFIPTSPPSRGHMAPGKPVS